MVIEVRDLPSGRLIRFNGTTEWALDSVAADEVLWIPWEHQLRALLGDRFAAMERVPGEVEGYAVVLTDGSRHVDVDPERAYAHAVLAVLDRYQTTSATSSIRRGGASIGTATVDACSDPNAQRQQGFEVASETSYVAKSSRVTESRSGSTSWASTKHRALRVPSRT